LPAAATIATSLPKASNPAARGAVALQYQSALMDRAGRTARRPKNTQRGQTRHDRQKDRSRSAGDAALVQAPQQEKPPRAPPALLLSS
jgi:hypothetical protein